MRIGFIVINLDRSTERLAKISASLRSLHIEFDRLPGTSIADIPGSGHAHAYDSALNRTSFYKDLSPGEQACYISHQRAWRHLLTRDWDAALVFEDDAIPSPDMLRALQAIPSIHQPWDILKLGSFTPKPLIAEIPVTDGFTLCDYFKIPVCAHAQVISRAGAEKLLSARARIARPIDVDLQYAWEHHCRIFGLTPYTVRADNVPSDTWTATNTRDAFRSHRLRFYRSKLRFVFDAFRYNLRQHGWRRTLRAVLLRRYDQR